MNNLKKLNPEAGQAMESNDEANKAWMEKIFGNPLILNNILEQFPNSNLLELSLVNKLWKKEARSVMKKRGGVTALLDSDGTRACGQVFKDFAAHLETFNEVIYSGMTIRLISRLFNCEGTGVLKVEAIHESIVIGMRGKLTRLSIDLRGVENFWNASDCPDFLLLRLLLRDFAGNLEQLKLETQDDMEPFIQEYLPHGPYPKLKVFKLNDGFSSTTDEETFGNQIKMFLSRAPNLQEIHTDGNVFLRENLLEGREGVVHVFNTQVCDPMRDIPENFIPALRLKWIWLFYNTEPQLELDRFNEKAQSLLRTCCATTLEYLALEEASAVLFMSYGIQLVNVTLLEIGLDYLELEQFEPRLISILLRLNFTYLFPKLERVCIVMPDFNLRELSRDIMDAIIEQASAVPMEPTLPRAGNVKKLYFSKDLIPRSAFQFFAHMFPAIQELYVDAEDGIFPVESAWELWPLLKRIKKRRDWCQRP